MFLDQTDAFLVTDPATGIEMHRGNSPRSGFGHTVDERATEAERAIRAAWQQQAHLPDGERYLATARATGAPLSVIWPVVRVHESNNAPCPNDS
jgi:hypothetical protein